MRKLGLSVLFLAVLLALLCVSSGAFAASSGSCGNNVTYVLNDDGVLTISGTGEMENYSSTTSAPWGADVKSVVIEDGVTSIGDFAFRGCSGLTGVTIPDSVTNIGNQAFSNCSSLTSVTIPDSVTSIGYYAFYKCTSLTSVTIPGSVTSIEDYMFYGCRSLTSVMIQNGVISIGNGAFLYCTSLTSVTIPTSVTSIGNDTFFECFGRTKIYYDGLVSQLREITIGTNNDGVIAVYFKFLVF